MKKFWITVSVVVCASGTGAFAEIIPAADCVITPSRITDLSSPVMGVLEDVLVDRSDRVEKGQVVATLESSVEQAAVSLARVRSEIQSEVDEELVNNEHDIKRKRRMDSLYKQKTVSEEVRDESERDERLSKIRLQQAMDLKQIRAHELAGMEARLQQKTIRAPFDGYVLERLKDQGEYVEEQAILRLAQLHPLRVEAIYPIELFGKIRLGMDADIVMEAFPNRKLSAKVVVVDAVGNAASGTFGVRLEMANEDNAIPAGLKCQAQIRQ